MKKSPVVHPFYRKMMTKFIQERVKTLTNEGGTGGGGCRWVTGKVEKPSLFVILTKEQNLHTAQYFGAVCCTFQLYKVSYAHEKQPPLATTRWSTEMLKN